jgi:hypothetical protein
MESQCKVNVRTMNSILTNIRSYVISIITPKGIQQFAHIHPVDGKIQVVGEGGAKTYYKDLFEYIDVMRKEGVAKFPGMFLH